MAHNVDTMMYVREVPWHGLGTKVMEAPNSEMALQLAELNWKVEQCPIATDDGEQVAGYLCNRRSDTHDILGVVSDRYQVVQNSEAFAFTDRLVGGDVKYETAGSLSGGRRVWLLARLPQKKVVGDDVVPYLCFVNSHDGTSAIRVCMTPIRVVCNNTLNVALNSAKRQWSTCHKGDLGSKMYDAAKTLEMAESYMSAMIQFGDMLANTRIAHDKLDKYINALFPIHDDDSERKKANVQRSRTEFMTCYYAPDIKKFEGTAWGLVNAASDMATHTSPARATKKFRENNWGRLMDGHVLIDSTVSLIKADCTVK